MKIRLFAACILSACALIAIAEVAEPSQEELAEKLLTVTDVSKTSEQMYDIMIEMLPMQMKRMGIPDDVVNDVNNKYTKKVMDFVEKEVGWEAMKNDFIALYAEAFTKEELEGAIAFYTSDVGKAFIQKQPELMKKSMEISQKRMMTVMPKLQQMMQESLEEMKNDTETPEQG